MGIGSASLAIDLLNSATTWVADVATGGSSQLQVGGVYTLQGLAADTYLGFGATSAAAITDGGSGRGELLLSNAVPRLLIVNSPAASWVGCSGGSLRIRRCQVSP